MSVKYSPSWSSPQNQSSKTGIKLVSNNKRPKKKWHKVNPPKYIKKSYKYGDRIGLSVLGTEEESIAEVI